MKSLIKCIECKKLFWAKVKKDKVTREVYVDIRDQYCRTCKNKHLRENQPRRGVIREVPEKFEGDIVKRELAMAERERRQKEAKEKKEKEQKNKELERELKKRRKRKTKPIKEMLTTPFNVDKKNKKVGKKKVMGGDL